MKRELLIIALAAISMMTALVSCEKEEFAEPPEYGKLYCRNSNPKVGDTVILAVQVINPGNRIYHADYSWKCNGMHAEKIFNKTQKVTAPDGSKTIEEEPSFSWVFTEAGYYEVSMTASFKISMATKSGQIYLPSKTVVGSVTIK